ncbi:Type I restriction enzyme R protein N terminal domain protein [Planktothrix tepida]|uniref:Type I restriction enzyme R protein N terminal domain protein n=2 Tax=Planktothrix TaxID=54304 RepID=A0A1J1LR45_9CYAN|nr:MULTISPECIES: type I restriction endonuclease subunit R [Planktothrix]CAD5953033.1 Type I restriction enzyme R protein N terminal domain protein [Planktothrix pseudagardhii]CAD5957503.1 Type I restriction enzyme R protein N terminal domain protein [Planktothrix tepida]CUR34041.1 Type I restriction enzyme R protein N terminal domain protein [Planktothrix tepida PCC 9214]
MTQTFPIERTLKTFSQLQTQFNLQRSTDDQFFTEWLNSDNELTQQEQQVLDAIQQKYFYQLSDNQLGEETIKLIVLSPLLNLAGFFDAPFRFKTKTTVQITVDSNDIIYRGRIDALILLETLWVVVIESKETSFSLELALPQTLAYMLGNPTPEKPVFGMVTNGGNFIFVKLQIQEFPQYELSNIFSLLPRRNQLYEVLQILKGLGQIAIQSNQN